MPRKFLDALLAHLRFKSASPLGSTCRPTLEALEDRFLPSASHALAAVHDNFSNSALISTVSAPADPVSISNVNSSNPTIDKQVVANLTTLAVQSAAALTAKAATFVPVVQTAPSLPTIVAQPGVINEANLLPKSLYQTDPYLALTGGGGEEPDYAVVSPYPG